MKMATHLALMQSPDMGLALTALGRGADLVTTDAGHALVIRRRIGPLGEVRFSSQGPVFADQSTLADRVAMLRAARLHLLNAANGTQAVCRAAGFAQVMTPATTAILPVAFDTDAQMRMAHGKWRSAARAAARAGLTLTRSPLDGEHAWLFAREAAQQNSRGYRALPPALTRAYAQANPGQAQVFAAHQDGEPIAAMLVLTHGPSATYHIGWSGDAGRRARAHHAVLMAVTDWLRDTGIATLDLGGLDTRHAPGLARFKLGSGAAPLTLGGTWIRWPRPSGAFRRWQRPRQSL
ncbi:Acetyltransferase (GNAT) domain-containing protein [Loktanella sp. DSM 29012]|nr:Acetyltransferase (GNAT) domain-containing protein [Loktanella sp. DSM 29012]